MDLIASCSDVVKIWETKNGQLKSDVVVETSNRVTNSCCWTANGEQHSSHLTGPKRLNAGHMAIVPSSRYREGNRLWCDVADSSKQAVATAAQGCTDKNKFDNRH